MDEKRVSRSAIGFAFWAVAFVSGVGGFLVALDSDGRKRWVLILIGIGIGAASAVYAVVFVSRLVARYRAYPRLVAEVEVAQGRAVASERVADQLRAALPEARNDGITEGYRRHHGQTVAELADLTPKYWDHAAGLIRITAERAPMSDPQPELIGGRYMLMNVGSGTLVGVLSVTVDGATVILEPTDCVEPDSWERLTDRAIAGETIPPGLSLRACTLEDYETLNHAGPYPLNEAEE